LAGDLLILAVLAKVLWDLTKDGLITEGHFVLIAIGLAFLLGLSGRLGKVVLKEGLTIVTLIIFVASLYQGTQTIYLALFTTLMLIYFGGKIARLSRWWFLAGIGLLLAFLLFRYMG